MPIPMVGIAGISIVSYSWWIFLALLIRWLRLGCRHRREHDQFDPNYQQAFRDEVLAPIMKYYFRGELRTCPRQDH